LTTPSDAELVRGEWAEKELNGFITERTRFFETEAQNERERIWKESEMRFRSAHATERRREWYLHHLRMATLHEGLAESHRQQLGRPAKPGE